MDKEIHATHNLAEKRQERKCGKGEKNTCDRDRRRELEKTLETHRVLNIGEGE
jgi:hypothetical protein